jgi:hypothetical protein
MKKYVEWTDENGKNIRLRFEGKREDAERATFNISRVWKSESTKLIIEENGAEKTALEIIRK